MKVKIVFNEKKTGTVSVKYGTLVSPDTFSDTDSLTVEIADEKIDMGSKATIVTAGDFSFFLRDVNSKSPIYVPSIGAAALPEKDTRSYQDVAIEIAELGEQSDFDRINSEPERTLEEANKVCRIAEKKPKIKKKRGRKSKAEKEAMLKAELEEIHTRSLALQGGRTLEANLEDLPQGCDWGGKRDSKGNAYHWRGYKLHLSIGDGGVPLASVLSSASLHDSQVAIPLMQKVAERATVLYDLADSGYDAGEIRDFSSQLGHVPIIDCNKRRGEYIPFAPAEQRRYCERSTVERGNSDLKDNYGARHVRVKGHWKVWCHLMFGVIAIAVKQLYNMIV